MDNYDSAAQDSPTNRGQITSGKMSEWKKRREARERNKE